MAAVPQHSKMVLVLLESVFLHSECRCEWGLSRCHQHYREEVWFLQVSVSSCAVSLQNFESDFLLAVICRLCRMSVSYKMTVVHEKDSYSAFKVLI